VIAAALVILAACGAVRAEEWAANLTATAMMESSEPAATPGLPAEAKDPRFIIPATAAIPEGPDGRPLRWIIRPWVGMTTVRLGSLDNYPAKSARIRQLNIWCNAPYSATISGETGHGIDYGIISGLAVGYQFHPLFSAGLKAGYLKTEQGSYTARAAGTASITDNWTTRMDSIMALAGISLKMPLTEKTRLYSSLYVGESFSTVYVYHQFWYTLGGATSLTEAQATGFGTGFVPEFTLHLEHDLAPAMAVGCDLGYRFGGVSSFKHRHTTNLNYMTGTGFETAGSVMRDAEGTILAVDHGGLVFALALTARL
jgi:hypothetical protein